MIHFDFKDRTAIITGGAKGFGLDIAKKFLDFGANVIIWDVDKKELEKSFKEINNDKLSFNIVDVANFDEVDQTVKQITKSINIDIFCFSSITFALLFGRSRFNAFGLTKVEVSMKKINNRKTISVIEDILKLGLTLFLLLNAIIYSL